MPKVSIIIPVYNAHNYLARCLDSVCNQTLKDIEIIAVDDCSTDDSLEILNEYAAKYPQLKVIAHKENGGESKARNTGIDNATGEYLAFVDNDDTVDLDFYEKLYNKATETNADIVKGEAHIFETNGTDRYDGLNDKIREHGSKLFFSSCWWTAIYKKQLIKDNNIRLIEGYPLGGDVLFLNEAILKCNKLELIDSVCYNYYRRDDSGDSKILTFAKVKSALEIHEKILENTLKEESIKNDYSGLKHIANWSMINAINYSYRNKTIENLKYCIGKIVKFYSMSNKYFDDMENIKDIYPVIFEYIKAYDTEGLVDLFVKNDTQQKMFITNLRYLNIKKHQES